MAQSPIDLLVSTTGELVTCAGMPGPRRGAAMREVAVRQGGAVAIRDGMIVAVDDAGTLRSRYAPKREIDAGTRTICPGFVDPHTHVVYAGDRVAEFERRIAGASYLEIMAAGGGIVSTMRATRAASREQLAGDTRRRLDAMLRHGTTTVEAKTGYGLETAAELRQLETLAELDRSHPADLVPTFLGAHALPPEYREQPDAYVDLVVDEMLPAAAAWYRASHFAASGVPMFADVFCEQGAFNVLQARRVLEAARSHGLPLKAHVDEFVELGGLALALELGAVSVDHLDATGADGIAALAHSNTLGVVIPTVTFHLGGSHFASARAMIDAGVALALTTDINPGSAPCPSLPMAMAIASRYQRLLPAETLIASTVNAAYAIGLGDKTGSLEPGKWADLLILDTRDYRHLAYEFGGNLVQTVIKRGVVARASA